MRDADGVLATECGVVLASGEKLKGTTVSVAKRDEVDLAIVLVHSAELETLFPIGSFDSVRVGEPVLAIGNPLGLDNSVTQGIISAKRLGNAAPNECANQSRQ